MSLTICNLVFLTHNEEHLFLFQWKWPTAAYIFIRVFLSLYTTGALIAVCAMNATYTLLQFLTVWTYILLTLHFMLTAVITVVHHFRRPRKVSCTENQHEDESKSKENPGFVGEKMEPIEKSISKTTETDRKSNRESCKAELVNEVTWYMKLSWLLSNIVQVFSVIVTVVYFSAIYPTLHVSDSELINDTNMHAINTIFVLVDSAICARPVRILHFVYPLIYGLVYIGFSVVVYGVSGTVIYNVLDYSQPLYPSITVPGLAILVIPLLQLAFYGLYRLRVYTSTKFQKHTWHQTENHT